MARRSTGNQSSDSAGRDEDSTATSGHEAEDHEASDQTIERLEKLQTDQEESEAMNPDLPPDGPHYATTEGLLSAPATRPHTIDPQTGQIHYVGDVSSLPGGTVEHEADV